MPKQYLVADLFCGAGGSSTGAERAFRAIGAQMILVCVNHWPLAIETHKKNHPMARHYVEDVSAADPERIVPEGYLDLLMASPECRFFSRARGGKPIHDQSRMNPWAVQRWLTALKVRTLLVENVPEFVEWGPLNNDNRPDPAFRGLYFEAWVRSLWELGYTVEWKYLNAADYGDATTRTRFFLQARKDSKPIRWPTPSHSQAGTSDMIGKLSKWRAAREIIDWDNPGRSLLDDPKYCRRPLSENTRRRIARGLQRYGGIFAPLYISLLGLPPEEMAGDSVIPEQFVIQNRKNAKARSLDQPVHTITASNGGGGLTTVKPEIRPFVLGQQSCGAPRSTDEPIPTVTGAGAISLIDPQMVVFHGASENKPVDEPVSSLLTNNHIGLVNPQIVKYYGTKADTEPVDEPLSTVTTKGRFGLVQGLADAFIIPNFGERDGQKPRTHSVEDPLPAVTGRGAGNLVEPLLIQTDQAGGRGPHSRSVDKPLGTIVTKQNMAVVEPKAEPFQFASRGWGKPRSIDAPIPTITNRKVISVVDPVMVEVNHGGAGDRSKSIDEPILRALKDNNVDPHRLVLIDEIPYILDIRFRMLTNRELARAMGFDDQETEYEFIGTVAEVTKQIGNAVPVNLAAALVRSIFERPKKSKKKVQVLR